MPPPKPVYHAPLCPYCRKHSKLVKGSVIYGPGKSYSARDFFLCQPCGAYVGTHPGTLIALGRLANKDLRAQKVLAHSLLDPLWKAAITHRGWTKSKARKAAYRWLAGRMGIDPKRCHIGWFDEEQTAQVIEICSSLRAAMAVAA